MDIKIVQKNLIRLGYTVRVFADKEEACTYLNAVIDGKKVGIGGSVTAEQMRLFDTLSPHNQVFCHLRLKDGEDVMQVRKQAAQASVYISSVNAISMHGEIVNIDNTGNRVAAATFGCDQVYFVIGQNKITEDLTSAIARARNVAAPKNARRLGLKTPCAAKADKCYDCDSAGRICRNLSVFWKKPTGCQYEILLIEQELGF